MNMALPQYISPQLSSISSNGPPESDSWLHEIKLDGFRMLCRKERNCVTFFSRRGENWGDRFSLIASEIKKLNVESAWLDGELVVMREDGRSCFGSLQKAFSGCDNQRLSFYVFDLIYCDRDLSEDELWTRKQALSKLILGGSWNLQYVDHIEGQGMEFFEAACEAGLEGIISKRADSPYREGARTRTWLKSKSKSYPRNEAWEWWAKKGI